MPDFQHLKSPDGRDFQIPLSANPGEFYYIWNEIYGDLKIYDNEDCPQETVDLVRYYLNHPNDRQFIREQGKIRVEPHYYKNQSCLNSWIGF